MKDPNNPAAHRASASWLYNQITDMFTSIVHECATDASLPVPVLSKTFVPRGFKYVGKGAWIAA